jgi:hypothetical protein
LPSSTAAYAMTGNEKYVNSGYFQTSFWARIELKISSNIINQQTIPGCMIILISGNAFTAFTAFTSSYHLW